MKDPSGASGATEFTIDWASFETRLAELFGELAQPGAIGAVRLRYPTGDGALGEVALESTTAETLDFGPALESNSQLQGVNVVLPGQTTKFYQPDDDSGFMPEPARDVCEYLRSEALVAHPSLLTAEGDGVGDDLLNRLGLPGPGGVLREARPPKQANGRRKIARRGGSESAAEQDGPSADAPLGISWPRSVDEIREVVEEALTRRFGSATMDDDGDYIVDTSDEGGTRFYVTVINDQPLLAFRKMVVLYVNSRRSAVIEANYLNRDHLEIRWVLRGYTLNQEYCFSTAPFVPSRFIEMVEQFSAQYPDSVSALRLRLGDE